MPHLKPKLPTNAPVSPMPRNLSHPSLTPQPVSFWRNKSHSGVSPLIARNSLPPTASSLSMLAASCVSQSVRLSKTLRLGL
ncbi:hypothetical protein DSO57_1019146 [Entomophthora muscae]|uniref:Uncharacterized protein n=1 Tax=Entomophthora muscae TaxID=34485 RepID=A0ACC2RV25_9FUNG|nr:hypothetical protein DSO57_1019146 [Entomophthora muscae]